MGRRRWWRSRAGGTVLLLSATVVSLTVTIVAGFLTRMSLIEAHGWVSHTSEVKLAIDACQLALVRGDAQMLARAEADVERLTADNVRQQQNIARAALLTERNERDALGPLFFAMQREEDGLMTERADRVEGARARSATVFALSSVLTLVFGAAAFSFLLAQRRELGRQRALLEAIIEGVDEGIIALDAQRNVLAINAAARALWGASFPKDKWPTDWRPVLRATYEDGSPMAPEHGPLARALRGEVSENVVYRVEVMSETAGAPAGAWVSASAHPLHDESGAVIAAVTTLRDVTEQRANAERLRDQSLTDELTGLLNRRGFMTLAHVRLEAARKARAPLALCYADVNGLKPINDNLGHEQGDHAIQDAAQALRSVFRGGDIAARIGGDEFVALLPGLVPSARDPLLERLAKAARAQAEREGRPYQLSMSADVTFVDWDAAPSLDALLAEADRKMYERKRERAGQSASQLRAARGSRP